MAAETRPSVYVETTVPSYLTAWPSRDVILLGHQQTTKLFWDAAPARYDLVISEAVLEEISAGDAGAAAERIRILAALPVLQRQPQVDELALYYRQLPNCPIARPRMRCTWRSPSSTK